MLHSRLLEQPVIAPSMTLVLSVQDQSYEDMVHQTPLDGNQDMRNDNGDLSQALVLVIPKMEEPEELSRALQATDLSFL